MKILVLFGPDQFGGSFVIAEKVARHLKDLGHDVVLVLKDPVMVNLYSQIGYKVLVLPEMNRAVHFVKDLRVVFALIKIYEDQGFDLIHSHTSKGGFYSRFLKLVKPSANVLHTVHGYYFSSNPISNKFYTEVERFLLKYCNGVVFVNNEDFNLAKKWYRHPLARVIHNGVDVNSDVTNRIMSGELLKIAVNARLVWEKGFKDIIEVVKLANQNNFEFHIMGDGANRDDIHRALESYSNVKFYGNIDYVQDVLKICDVNLLLSYREGLSLSILEAMSMGLPTIAYNIRGNRELVVNSINGVLVEKGNIEAILRSLNLYLVNPEMRRRHSISAHERVKDSFSVDKMLMAYREIIDELISSVRN